MANNPSNTEKIERYLQGDMSVEEKQGFELEIVKDREVKALFEEYNMLHHGLDRIRLKAIIRKIRIKIQLKNFSIGLGIVILVSSIAFFGIKYFTDKEMNSESTESLTYTDSIQMPGYGLDIQNFEIDNSRDTIIQTKNGILFPLPSNTFISEDGSEPCKNIKISVQEAFSAEEIISSGLSTSSDGQLLETDGMFFIEAECDGKKLTIDPEQPILVEVPKKTTDKDMMLFDGEIDSTKRMNWIDPVEEENLLISVDIHTLDFYPPGFLEKLQEFGYDVSNKKLTDSIFYTFYSEEVINLRTNSEFEVFNAMSIPEARRFGQPPPEPLYPQKYSQIDSISEPTRKGIEPASIKAIWNDKFQGTLIATKEFEKRLKVIYESCDEALLDLYIENLNQPLFEIDKKAAIIAPSALKHKFQEFASHLNGSVKIDDKRVSILSKYYSKQRRAVLKAIKETNQKFWAEQRVLDKISDKKRRKKAEEELRQKSKAYCKEYQMNLRSVYQQLRINKRVNNCEVEVNAPVRRFQISTTGWKNIDAIVREITLKRESASIEYEGKEAKLEYGKLNIRINEEEKYDRIYVYLTSEKVNTYIRLDKIENQYTYSLNQLADYNLVCIGYFGKQAFIFSKKKIESGDMTISLLEVDKNSLNQKIKDFSFSGNIEIGKDLEYQDFIYRDNQRRIRNAGRRLFRYTIYNTIFPCGRFNRAFNNQPSIEAI